LTPIRRRRPAVAAPAPRVVDARGPFAALAALKR
jgi:ribosome-associated heat shock protein Hsp15